MIKSLLQVLGIFVITQASIAQTNLSHSDSKSDTIPIELTEHNNIAVKAILNEVDTLLLMVHTAVNDISLTKNATARMASIVFNAVDSVESWGGGNESRYSQNNYLEIAQFNWKNIGIWESEYSGHDTDGKFGLNLFEGKIVELNFAKEYMVIHSNLPDHIDSYDQLRVINENGLIFIEGQCKIGQEVYFNKFLIHSGYSGAILLDDDFVAQNRIGQMVETVSESTLKDSYGNELKTINAILPSFQLSGIEYFDVPISFFEGSINRQKMSVLGGDIIKRFDVIFDLNNSNIYLRSNQLVGMPYSTK